MESINLKDREILRELAKHKLELFNEERNQLNLTDWLLHNTFRGKRPMIHLEIGCFWLEVFPQRLKCEGKLARNFEERLWESFINYEVFRDDYPVTDYFHVERRVEHIPFGVKTKVTHAVNEDGENTLGFRIDNIINDLEQDYHILGSSIDTYDKKATTEYADAASDIFGDILPVRIKSNALYSVPTRYVVNLMGMENMFIAMCDYPELFHKMMKQFADDTIAYFRFLENNDALNPTTGAEYVGQGSWCFTDELPSSGTVTSKDVWGFLDSQETVGVSPSMYAEMVFPYYEMIAEQYGLLSYGCCEPVHPFWENCLSKLKNLRKVSISPWCDEEYMGAMLKGRKTIYHRKPRTDYLGIDVVLDEDALRADIRKTLKAAQGCTLEITQRDIYTIHNNESKAIRYVEIIKEEINNHW